jgi:D-3-phosphoglycerate dehydrogenase
MARFRIVHTGQPPGAPLMLERRALAEAGVDAEVISYGKRATPEQVLEAARDADVVLIGLEPFPAEVVRALPRTRALIRYGVGVDTIDQEAATEQGILVVNIADYCIEEVSNHALALLLASARKVARLDRAMRAGDWSTGTIRAILPPMGGLTGETLGVAGFGNIGRASARKAQAFGLKVIAFDPYVTAEVGSALGVEMVDFASLLERSDYVTIHAPLTRETHHLFDAAALARMKPTAYLINTARGPLVDEAALAAALAGGKLAGAGLDVFENEPLAADSPLLTMENVIMTPHAGAYSDRAMPELQRRVGEEAAKVLRGERPSSVVNAEVLGRANRLEG